MNIKISCVFRQQSVMLLTRPPAFADRYDADYESV